MRHGLIVALVMVMPLVGCGLSIDGKADSHGSKAAGGVAKDAPARTGVKNIKAAGSEPNALLRDSFSDCIDASEGITPRMQACIEAEYGFHERRLRSAYAALLQSSSGEIRRQVERSQAAWSAMDEKECQWNSQTEGQGQRLEANVCSLRRVAKRALELERELESRK